MQEYFNVYLRLLHGHDEDESDDDGDNGGLPNILVKVASLVFLLGLATGFGFMPYFINKCRTSNKFLGFSNAFSGGIFLGMGLFHILPESHELLEELTEVPVAFFCAFGSYAIILFVEKIAFDSHSLVHGAHSHGEEDHDHDHDENGHSHDGDGEKKEDNEVNADVIVVQSLENQKSQESNRPANAEKTDSQTPVNSADSNQSDKKEKPKGVSSYVLLLALGFHGFFEGISLGIQTTLKGTIFLLIAITAHKWAASLTLGISFVKAGVSKKQYITMILIFAFITPVGIALGMILASTANESVEGIFLAISVGTFIYIACSEVIVDEFAHPQNKYAKFGMFLLGAAVTAGLSLLELIDGFGH